MHSLASITLKKLEDCSIHLPSSKSESNRALIINALCKNNCHILNISNAEDTILLQNALESAESNINIKNAGTAMRFLIAYFAAMNKQVTITGNDRMLQRPVKPLVDALNTLGADIEYLQTNGYPPVHIKNGSNLKGGHIKIPSHISSQFITGLLLIAPLLKNGLKLEFLGHVVSWPYIEMTLSMMKHFGICADYDHHSVSIPQQEYEVRDYCIEGDWTSAAYWYAITALSKNPAFFFEGLKRNSYQGDAVISKMMEAFGVITEFSDRGIFITRGNEDFDKFPRIIDFTNHPDLAQTLITLFAATGISCRFKGLETLRIKETDRIAALQNELKKFSIHMVEESKDVYTLQGNFNTNATPVIETYGDHRMAMSFAPLAVICPNIKVTNPGCVEKSYPSFWNDLSSAGFEIIFS